uniref:C3H1-type domain-containing protein n=1 Tax=Plectus sambesii TaxID=2011161 RepID=A0A914XP73_9BILA
MQQLDTEDNFHNFASTTSLPDNCPRPQQSEGRSFPAKSRHFDEARLEWSVLPWSRRDSPESSSTSESISPTFKNYDDGALGKFHLSNGGLQLRRVRRSTTGSDGALSDLLNYSNRKKPIDYLRKRASEVLGRSKRIASGRPTIASGVCFAFNQDHYCPRGSLCRFTHGNQTNKEPLCARLLRGQCRLNAECALSHGLSREQMPICDFFLRGICTSSQCPYLHVKFADSTPLCKGFTRGFCPHGRACSRPHIYPPSLWRRRGANAVDSRKREADRRPADEKSKSECSPKKMKALSSDNFASPPGELPDFIPIQDCNDDCYDDSGDEMSEHDTS